MTRHETVVIINNYRIGISKSQHRIGKLPNLLLEWVRALRRAELTLLRSTISTRHGSVFDDVIESQ